MGQLANTSSLSDNDFKCIQRAWKCATLRYKPRMAAYIVHRPDTLLLTAVSVVSFELSKQLTPNSRAYTYKRLKYHYFLFDMCYYATILNLAFLWLFSSSEAVFVAAYCMTMGECIISACLVSHHSRPARIRCYHLEEQSRLPQFRQNNVVIHTHLPTSSVPRDHLRLPKLN